MKNYRLKTGMVILVAGLHLTLTACNSEDYTNAQKPKSELSGGVTAASQREARRERAAEKLKEQAQKASGAVEETAQDASAVVEETAQEASAAVEETAKKAAEAVSE
ncbi:MAG: hypothetical protein V3V18_04690 [Methylococcales bacterium]